MRDDPNKMHARAATAEDMAWAKEMVGSTGWPAETRAIAGYHGDERRVVVLYTAFYNDTCSMHVAAVPGKLWATRSMLREFFAYPFIQLGLRRVTAPIAERNIPSVVLAVKLGFHFEGRMIKGLKNDNEVLLGLLQEDCKWTR